jgi:hypothetical protein
MTRRPPQSSSPAPTRPFPAELLPEPHHSKTAWLHLLLAVTAIFLLVYFSALLVYLSNHRTLDGIDTAPARYIALRLLRDHTFDMHGLEPDAADLQLDHSARVVDGRYLSDFPVGPAIAAVPFYWLGLLLGIPPTPEGLYSLDHFAAANLAALAAALFWFVLRRTGASRPPRLIVWLVISFGTPLWVPSALALWQHAPLLACICAAMLCWPKLGRPGSISRYFLAGLFLGLAVVMRPTAVVLLPVWGLLCLVRRPIAAPAMVLGGAIGLLPLVGYQLYYFHSVLNGGYFQLMKEGRYFSQFNPLLYLAGHLVAPSRGMLVFTPFFLLLPLAFSKRVRAMQPNVDYLLASLSALAILCVVISYRKWWTGHGYGSRYMVDMAPFLGLLVLAPVTSMLAGNAPYRQLRRALVAVLAVTSVAVQAIGAFYYDGGWDAHVGVDSKPFTVFSIRNNTIRYCLSGGHDPGKPLGSPADYLLPGEQVIPINEKSGTQYLYSGFFDPEPWGVWSRGVFDGRLVFHLPEKRTGKLLLQVVAPTEKHWPSEIRFYLNGHLLGKHTASLENWQKFAPENVLLSVPADALNGDLERLEIHTGSGHVPNGHGRYIGVGIVALGWSTAG